MDLTALRWPPLPRPKNKLEDISLEIIQSEQQRKKDFIETEP